MEMVKEALLVLRERLLRFEARFKSYTGPHFSVVVNGVGGCKIMVSAGRTSIIALFLGL